MKTRLIAGILLLSFISSCHKNTDIGPADLLYKRWHIDQVKTIVDDAWISYDTDGYYDTEYRTDGTLIHRKDGVIRLVECCVAGRFERSGNVIQYTGFPVCPLSLCAPPQQYTITVLRNNLLELNDGQRIAQYSAVR